jgi:hypothetical protein
MSRLAEPKHAAGRAPSQGPEAYQLAPLSRPSPRLASRRSLMGSYTQRGFFLESIFQDPYPAANGTRRVTMPQRGDPTATGQVTSGQARKPAGILGCQ